MRHMSDEVTCLEAMNEDEQERLGLHLRGSSRILSAIENSGCDGDGARLVSNDLNSAIHEDLANKNSLNKKDEQSNTASLTSTYDVASFRSSRFGCTCAAAHFITTLPRARGE